MKCPKEKDIAAYIFGELPPGKRKTLDAHISGCPACRRKLATLEKTRDAAASVTPDEVSADFTAQVMQKLDSENPADAPAVKKTFDLAALMPALKPAWGLVFAGIAVCIITGTVLFRGKHAVPPRKPAQTIYLTDEPAVVNVRFAAQKGYTQDIPLESAQAADEPEGVIIYTDSCMTAKCGIL